MMIPNDNVTDYKSWYNHLINVWRQSKKLVTNPELHPTSASTAHSPLTCQTGSGVHPLQQLSCSQLSLMVCMAGHDGLAHLYLHRAGPFLLSLLAGSVRVWRSSWPVLIHEASFKDVECWNNSSFLSYQGRCQVTSTLANLDVLWDHVMCAKWPSWILLSAAGHCVHTHTHTHTPVLQLLLRHMDCDVIAMCVLLTCFMRES